MDERSRRVERWFEGPVIVAALLVIPIIAVEQSDLGEGWKTAAAIANWIVWLVFAAELIVMLAVVPDRLRWLRTHPVDVAIVVFTPPVLPPSLQALRVLRLLRLLPLVRAAQIARRSFSLQGVRYASLIALFTALAGGTAFAAVEENRSTWDGVWWAVATMTTVGYGELAPRSDWGRIVGIGVMLVGIGFIAFITGAIAQRFLAEEEDETLRELRAMRERLDELETRLR